ncbi:hypothetical protein [Paracoccus salsus]|uniref:hypothetical protein n=1 Tax=Paracoccus salsus TaxID=2911061 RepID=UPI001F21D66E|nr:hypothetical protein [Paracoccus salsus]MCF3974511.1 hypothetical protein [Paracoccus salsus]
MSRNILKISAATLALVAGLGHAALAQGTAPVTAADDLPAALRALNLEAVQIRQGPRGGRKIEGDLPGGGEIEALVNDRNDLVMVEVDDIAMPQPLLEALLPQTVRDNDILTQFAQIERVGGRDGRFMVSGEDADGTDLRAGFDQDGRLLRFGRDEDDHGKRGKRGMGGHREGRGGDHGAWNGKGGDRQMRGVGDEMRGGPEGRRSPDGLRGMPPIDRQALNERLGGAGYTELAAPRPAGPRLLVDATNPAGEAVTLEVDPAGEVIRETAR